MSGDRAWTWTPQVEAGQVVATLRRPPAWQIVHDMTAFLKLSFHIPIVVRHPESDDGFYTFVVVPRA